MKEVRKTRRRERRGERASQTKGMFQWERMVQPKALKVVPSGSGVQSSEVREVRSKGSTGQVMKGSVEQEGATERILAGKSHGQICI